MLRTACRTTWEQTPGYTGLITRNPINPGPECFTHWGRMLPYTLGELDKVLPKGKPPSRRLSAIGRNCDLFKSMVSEVFRQRWGATSRSRPLLMRRPMTLSVATTLESLAAPQTLGYGVAGRGAGTLGGETPRTRRVLSDQ